MRVAVTGSHGLIGSALCQSLRSDGHEVIPIVRSAPAPGQVEWDPHEGFPDLKPLEGIDAVVHLAGEPIGTKRWTLDRKAHLRDSRVHGTGRIAQAILRLQHKPAVLVSASAVGWYGDRGDEELTEQSAPGSGFLADLSRQWEGATRGAEDVGVRVVHLRTGIVLSRRGGALAKQLPLYRIGLGGRLGSGRQWFSWVTLADEVAAIRFAMATESLAGPVNVTAPNPVRQATFATSLAHVLRRPALGNVPMRVLVVVLGRELAEELTSSQRALPDRLEGHGFRFRDPELEPALRAMFRRRARRERERETS